MARRSADPARPIGLTGRFRRWCGRNPRVASLLGLILGLSVGGSILFASLWWDAEAARRAELRASRAKDAAIQQKEVAIREMDGAIEFLEHHQYGFRIGEAWKNLSEGLVENVRPILAETPARFRNLESEYLSRLGEYRIVTHPQVGTWMTAVHPDGERVAYVESPLSTMGQGPYLVATGKPVTNAPPVRPQPKQPHRVVIRDVRTNRDVRSWSIDAWKVLHVSYSDGGRRLVILAADPALTVWEVETGKKVYELAAVGLGSDRGITPPAESLPLPRYFAALAPDHREVRFWDSTTGQPLPAFRAPAGETISSFTASPDNETFVVTSSSQRATVNRYRGRIGSARHRADYPRACLLRF